MTDEMGAHFVATANRLCGRAAGIAVCLLVENGLCYCNNMACMSETLDATRNRTTACQCCVAKPIFCENAKGSNAIATVSDLHLRFHCAAKIFIHPDNVPVGAAFLGGHPMRRPSCFSHPTTRSRPLTAGRRVRRRGRVILLGGILSDHKQKQKTKEGQLMYTDTDAES